MLRAAFQAGRAGCRRRRRRAQWGRRGRRRYLPPGIAARSRPGGGVDPPEPVPMFPLGM